MKIVRSREKVAVQRFHDAGNGVRDCMREFGFSSSTWTDAVRRGDLVARPHAMPLEELLSAPRQRGHVKQRLIKLGLKENRCEICGISEWRGEPLSLALHHVNGDRHDNRLENLQLLWSELPQPDGELRGSKRPQNCGDPAVTSSIRRVSR